MCKVTMIHYNLHNNSINNWFKFLQFTLHVATLVTQIQYIVYSSSIVFEGVPQGLVLGLLLILIYIDDASDITLSTGSILNIYADNMLYKPNKFSADFSHLQRDLDCNSNSVSCNHLTLIRIKCKTIHILQEKNSTQPPHFFPNDMPLEQV